MKVTLQFIIFFFLPFMMFSQPVNNLINDIMMPAPNAASLGKYGDIPVSYNTGVPSISIPIHTVTSGPLSLPISLSYHSGGVRVGEPASWVGLGWSLQTGGYVTRTVQGIADERSAGYINTGSQLGVNSSGCVTVNGVQIGSTVTEMANGQRDGEPDIFSFGVGGYNGKFYIDTDTSKVVLVPKQDIKVLKTLVGTTGVYRIKNFTIITPDGTQYLFGDIGDGNPAIETTKSNDNNFNLDASTWYLKRIVTPDGKFSIDLSYTAENYSYYTRYSGEASGFAITPGGVHVNKTEISGFRLNQITTPTEKVTFLAESTDRQDLKVFPGSQVRALDKIKIEPSVANANYCKVFDLTTDYFIDNLNPQSDPVDKRLRLTSVREMSCDGTSIVNEPYVLEYYGLAGNLSFLPNRVSTAIDHWGYYNGAHTNNKNGMNMPFTKLTYNNNGNTVTYTKGNSNRETNETTMMYGTLKKITYPTGGNTQFEYEANDYFDTQGYLDSIPLGINLTGEQCSWNETFQSSATISFSSSGTNLNTVKYKWTNQPFSGYQCCQNQTARLKVYEGTTLIATVEGNTACPSGTPNINVGYLKDLIPALQQNHTYTFKMYVFSIKTSFTFYEEKTVGQNTNRKIGGLRIKQITSQEAASSGNDIIKTFEYRKLTIPAQSSGKLINLPSYSYVYSINKPSDPCNNGLPNVFITHFWISDNVAPLGSFEGNHISYLDVKENLNGNGYNVYQYFDETLLADNDFPKLPTPPMVNMGNISAQASRTNAGTDVSYSNNTIYPNDVYQFGQGVYIKTRWYSGSGGSAYAPWRQYSIRTKPFRLASTTSYLDGVTTTQSYEYGSSNYLFPTAEIITNSDNTQTRTEYLYTHDYTDATIKSDMLARYMLLPAWKTSIKVGGVQVGGSETEYGWFNLSTGLQQVGPSSAFPRHYKFYSYEKTWDQSGTLTGTGKTLKGTINQCDGPTGKPSLFTQEGWLPERYEWNSAGLITKRTYNPDDATPYKRFVTQYDYYPGTRLISKITNIDGQYMEYDYDKLMRTSVVKGRKTGTSTYNVLTTYTYQYKNATNPRSYVKTATTYTDMTASGSAFKEKTVWQYLDGLGRPVQTVDMKHSPAQKDVAVTTEYDNQGRVSKVYNPFESTLATGAFVATVPSGTPYTLSEYYSDPLNRTWKVTPPSWYPTIYAYGTNVASNVKLNHTTNTYYGANLLFRTTVTDPNGNKSITFKDKKGRLILSRRTDSAETASLNADTYNLYDNKDRLTTVIPPDATISNTNLLFKYLYDQADNMVMKDVPDADPMTMKYNTRNLMTLMQDGNLLATPNNWLATNYDIYGRPTSTGFVVNTASPDPNSTFTFTTANLLTATTYDDLVGGQAIYKGKVKQSQVKVMDTANNSFITTNYTYDPHGRVNGTTANNFTGGSDNYLFTYDWADNRLSSTRTHKRLSTDAATTIVEKTGYDHAGRATSNKHNLNAAPTDTYLSQLNYNYKDQLVEKNLGVGSTGILQSLDYAYNDQGWLTAINQSALGGTNIPVTSCNLPGPGAAGAPTFNPDPNDLFFLELKYDNLIPGMSGTLQKNGNIAQLQWRTRGRERQAYNFTYDTYDRLATASYKDISDGGTVTNSDLFSENIAYADKRGNISNLNRKGGLTGGHGCFTYDLIDNLTYSYTAGTNKLSGITDAASATYKAKGFNPGTGTGSYAYDVNGNLKTDPYKSMTIAYNHLNLPKLFTFANGAQSNTIEVLYDAAGTKLRKTVKTGTTTNYTQDYIGGIEYRDGAREAIYTAEGRVFYTSPTTTRYEYSIKDHLGNTRLTFTDKDNNGVVDVTNNPATNEILQENHYYPFGLNTEGPWMNDAALDNRYQYNGKELNDDFGLNLNDYGARWYDAGLGRWWVVDALIEFHPDNTGFNYVLNSPLSYVDPSGLDPEPPPPPGWKPSTSQEVVVTAKRPSADGIYNQLVDRSYDPTPSVPLFFGAGKVVNYLGNNSLPTRGKFAGATEGTSIASRYFRSRSWSENKIPRWLFKVLPKKVNGTSIRANSWGPLAGRLTPAVGRSLVVVSAGMSIYNVATSENKAEALTVETSGWVGMYAGAEAGAAAGAAIGALFGGVGAGPGAIIGGFLGGTIGYFGGAAGGQKIYDELNE